MCTVQYRRVPWKTRVAEKDRKGIKRDAGNGNIPKCLCWRYCHFGEKTVGKEIDLKYSKLFRYEDLVPGIMTADQFKRLKARGTIQVYMLPGPNTPGQYFINLPDRDETGANRAGRSAESSALQHRWIVQRLEELEQQRKNLLFLVCRILQAAPGYKLRPSELAPETVGDLSSLSQEAVCSLLIRMTKEDPMNI